MADPNEPEPEPDQPVDIQLDVHDSRLVVTEPTQEENEDGQGRP
jgi:hypothetical protein